MTSPNPTSPWTTLLRKSNDNLLLQHIRVAIQTLEALPVVVCGLTSVGQTIVCVYV